VRKLRSLFLGFAAILGAVASLHADSVFDFQGIAENTPTPITDTQNGVTATFTGLNASGTPTAGWFAVGGPATGNQFQIFGAGAHFLINADTQFGSLQVDFSQPVTNLNVSFVTNSTSNDPNVTPTNRLFLNAFAGANAVGSTAGTGVLTLEYPGPPPLYYPEGNLTLLGTFDRLIFNSESFEFAIGNLDVNTAIPEPTSLPLLSIGLSGIMFLAYLNRREIYRRSGRVTLRH
jgi:hypothetical protein